MADADAGGARVGLDAAQASGIPDARPGDYVVLQVRDTGTGIAPEILDRIFDPFFTTKGPDKGTGLGLSTAIGIVKGHEGFMQVSSQPGEGSTFATYLPVEGWRTIMRRCDGGAGVSGAGEMVLIVDDEASMRSMTSAVLRR